MTPCFRPIDGYPRRELLFGIGPPSLVVDTLWTCACGAAEVIPWVVAWPDSKPAPKQGVLFAGAR